MGKLTAKFAEQKQKPGFYGDGRNLWLKVKESGTRSWVFRYTIDHKERMMGLGPYPEVTLEQARAKALAARTLLKDRDNPRDPQEVKKELAAARRKSQFANVSFDEVVSDYIDRNRAGWSNPKHAAQWVNTLKTYATPHVGSLAVHAIEQSDVLRVLDPIWRTKTETASRVRQRMEKVLDYAITRGMHKGPNPARWKGHLDSLLPKPSKVSKPENHAALPHGEIGAFMTRLRAMDGIAPRAFEFLILTGTRTSEVINAKWCEIDLRQKLWIIPADRMKAGKEHRVPLSERAVQILKAVEAHKSTSDFDTWVFPGQKPHKPLSNAAFLYQLRERMNHADITPHGFRSTFRDWAGEMTAFPREVIEHALAHQLKDKAEAAYQRGDLLQKRSALMQAWAKRCESKDVHSATVTAIGKS